MSLLNTSTYYNITPIRLKVCISLWAGNMYIVDVCRSSKPLLKLLATFLFDFVIENYETVQEFAFEVSMSKREFRIWIKPFEDFKFKFYFLQIIGYWPCLLDLSRILITSSFSIFLIDSSLRSMENNFKIRREQVGPARAC